MPWRRTAASGTSPGRRSRRGGHAGRRRDRCRAIRGAAAPGQPAALRLPARDRRRAGQLGRAQGPDARPGGAPGGLPRRGPPDRVLRLRGRDPGRRVRRRRRHRLGRRHLASRRGRRPAGPGRGARGRRAAPRPVRREAARALRPGAHEGSRYGAGKEEWLLLHKHDEYAVDGLEPRGPPAVGAERPDQRRGQGRPGPAVALGPAGRPRAPSPLRPVDRGRDRRRAGTTSTPSAAAGTWQVFGRELRVTNLDKVLFPARPGEEPVTKRDLLRYAAQIAPDRAALPDRGGR